MKIKIIISVVAFIAAVFIYDAFTNFGSTNQSGAPAGYTGSPGDGISCDNPSCHSGNPVTNVNGWITSNIPGTGYVGGTTYTITATATYAGKVKFGFEVSPQDANGVQKGTCVVTDATHTQLSGSSKYITHTLTGTSGTTGSHTWTFNWVAPAQGSGTVAFYGAFNCSNNNGSSAGDLIYLSNLTVPEAPTNGTDASIAAISSPSPIICSTTFAPSVTLTNHGNTTLTAVNINYKVDNNAPTTFNWSGSLSSTQSTQCNLPVVTTTAGAHTFTVYTSNPNGGADAFTGNDTSKVNFLVSTIGAALPFSEGFESVTFPPVGWTRVNPDNGTTWARVTTAFHSGGASAKMDNYNYASGAGKHDDLVLPTINLSGSNSPKLTFYEAYTYVTGYYDSLQVLISTDCGATYSSIFYQGGTTLATAPQNVNAFTPTSAQWRLETIDLTPYNSASNAIIVFRNISEYGNNLYLDDINIASTSGIYQEQTSLFNVNVFPNPTKDNITVDFNLNNHSPVEIKIYDIYGKMVGNLLSKSLEKGSYNYKFDLNNYASGIYLLNISDAQGTLIKKIVIQ